MKRNMDLVRDILLEIEEGRKAFNVLPESHAAAIGLSKAEAVEDNEAASLDYHLNLLVDTGYIEADQNAGGLWINPKMTWEGHEFLDNIRDPDVWDLAKRGAAKAGGGGLEILGQLAKGLIRTQIEKHTGFDLG